MGDIHREIPRKKYILFFGLLCQKRKLKQKYEIHSNSFFLINFEKVLARTLITSRGEREYPSSMQHTKIVLSCRRLHRKKVWFTSEFLERNCAVTGNELPLLHTGEPLDRLWYWTLHWTTMTGSLCGPGKCIPYVSHSKMAVGTSKDCATWALSCYPLDAWDEAIANKYIMTSTGWWFDDKNFIYSLVKGRDPDELRRNSSHVLRWIRRRWRNKTKPLFLPVLHAI